MQIRPGGGTRAASFLPVIRRLALLLAAAALAAAALVPAFADAGGRTKTIKVGDDFFAPGKVTLRRGTTMVWKWSTANGDTHDVQLVRAPHGVRRFHSPSATADFSYRKRLTRPGTYKLLCTFHESLMRLTVVVK